MATRTHSPETREKLSVSHKGKTPWNKGLTSETDSRIKKSSVSCLCTDCGGKKDRSARYCIKCIGRHRVGDKNGNWRGGAKDTFAERVRFHESVRSIVLERDNYSCVLCGSNKGLQVDHIQSWSEHPDLRFDANNCRTLCMLCHYKLTFGRSMSQPVIWGGNVNLMREK